MCIRDRIEIDLFADPNNSKVKKFFSRYKSPGSQGTDAFAQDWSGLRAWVCPPTTKIVETVKKILQTKNMSGILVVPMWRSSSFWPFLCPDGIRITECFEKATMFRPFLVHGDSMNPRKEFTLMKGFTKFPFVALYIGASGKKKLREGNVKMPKL